MIAPRCDDCQPDRLFRLLHNRISVADEKSLVEHIETCIDCQSVLQELAAGDGEWETVRQSFAGNTVLESPGSSLTIAQEAPGCANPVEQDKTSFPFLEPPHHSSSLGTLGGIEIVSVIGKGGMGIVFKGYDSALKRTVAVKVLAPEHALSATARARFRREAESVAAVVHDNVVPIHAVHSDHNPPFLVMAFIPGGSLQERVETTGFLTLAEILRIGHQIACGLAAAHSRGIVHRDIKPANVLLEDGLDRVKLTDFGLARSVDDVMLTRLGTISGTPQFMSPEQARGERVDFRSDLFSLGITMYAMATGTLPFRAEQSMGVLNLICESTPQSLLEHNPDIPSWLETIVVKLLAKRPDDRFQSAEEVSQLLEGCLAHVQQPGLVALPPDLASIGSRTNKRTGFPWTRTLAVTIAILTTLALFIVSAGLLNPRNEAGNQQSDRVSAESSLLATDNVGRPGSNEKPAHKNDPSEKSLSPPGHQQSETYWLPGQIIPGENQIVSFDQGILRGHVFARTTDQGHTVLAMSGLCAENKIPLFQAEIQLIDKQGQIIPLEFQVACNSNVVSGVRQISFVQRTREPLQSSALIRLVIHPQSRQPPTPD